MDSKLIQSSWCYRRKLLTHIRGPGNWSNAQIHIHKDRIHGEIHKNQSGTRMNQNKMNGRRDCAVALFCSIFKEGAWPMFQCSIER